MKAWLPPPGGLPAGARLASLQAAGFAGIGIWLPFFPLWLEGKGLDATTIGIILALPILVRIAVTAPILSLTDRAVTPRLLLVAANAAVAVLYLLLAPLEGAWAIAAAIVILAVAQAPIIPGIDLVVLDAVRRSPGLIYGRIRLWGSVSFLAASILGGLLLPSLGANGVIWLLAGFAALSTAVALGAVPPRASGGARGEAPTAAGARLPAVIPLVIAAAALTQASHAAVYGFGSIHWRLGGFSDAEIGALWSVGILAEIALFALLGSSAARGRAAFWLMLAGGSAAAIRFGLMATAPGLAGAFALQALHGLTFGATHLGTMALLVRYAPEGARGRAQGTLAAANALTMALATAASGVLFREGGAWAFAGMVPVALAGLGFSLAALAAAGSQPQS